ncbi:HI1506-related protein [Escherichia coli]|uniref:HI1506-related protein n=1 Tax=Escherichia coli TaxID=562 RepID=UPI002FCCC727
MIEITARREGFRRCGVAHSATTKAWPVDAFTPEQLAVLKADPMLIVVERDKASGQNDTARGMNWPHSWMPNARKSAN